MVDLQNKDAVKDAVKNCKLNNIKNVDVYNNDAGVLCILRKCFRHAGFFPGDWHGKGNHDRYVFTDPYPLYTGGASGTGLWYIRCLYFCDHRLDTDAFI